MQTLKRSKKKEVLENQPKLAHINITDGKTGPRQGADFTIIRLTKKDRPFCSSKLILAFVNGLAFSKYLHKKYKICPRCAIIDERSTFNHFGPTNIFAHSFGHFLPPLLHRREMDVKKHSPLQPHNAWNHPFHISAFRPIRKGVFRSFFKHHKSNVIAINSY